jgi:ATP-dependent Lon protease
MTLKATGNLKKVIKESTEVATSLAWNHLDNKTQIDYLTAWKAKPQGFHIHCPDGAIPKDGPSAGTALTVAIYSILLNRKIRNDIAITGEITLDGRVTAIGGLEEKLVGAKKAGVRLALIPKENELHLEKVKERNNNLLDNNFNVITIQTLDEALKYSLV